MQDADHPKHYCGVFGIFNHELAAEMTYLGLYSLQHRGEESAGIASSDGQMIYAHKGMGLVGEVFHDEEIIKKLKGKSAIGHVRYSTSGSSLLKNAQPHVMDYSRGQVAIGHNGNITNAKRLRDELEAHGSIFQSTSDSEIIIHLMAKPHYRSRVDGLVGALEQVEGAFSLVILLENMLIGVRDPNGFRPLSLGKLGNSWVLASETCAFDLMDAKFERELKPGEVLVIDESGPRSLFPFKNKQIKPSPCIFEQIYFARPDSILFGDNVGIVREQLGMQLALEHPVEADMVIPVPDSGQFAAIGYARQSGLPFRNGFTRNHYIGRTFIQPTKVGREFKVKMKLNPIPEMLKDQRVVVVDDSIVRGNTARSRVRAIRKAGAKEVHLRISCPPHKFPCYYGIDFPDPNELLANQKSMDEIRKFLDADSVGYLSIEGMLKAVSGAKDEYCTCCFSGQYPVPVKDHFDKHTIEKGLR